MPRPTSPVFFACPVSVSDLGHAPQAGPLNMLGSRSGWWVFQRLRISRSYTVACGDTPVVTRRGLCVKAIVGFGRHAAEKWSERQDAKAPRRKEEHRVVPILTGTEYSWILAISG
jgi:hypothetical protein